ncbi:DUF6318 family protein [Phycicoccus sonneratiae]|uniref:DUF6318 domain-containing protein n=1 Tax=Phycicoccus sonneratiae TaxID=2807628 RepID=A0ABS2CK36_9MICO|nr:DUF6318 family protein [Phycicoccus sonneraticus]MBM6400252.1 hypothetical protein [Phycicoccus sonneraticus]
MAGTVRWAVVAMLAAGVLAGCDSADDPVVTSTPSASSSSASPTPSPSPSPSVTESGPQIPAAAREQTDAGAEAFVKFYMEQFNVAWTKPEAGLVAKFSAKDCKFCATVETQAKWLVDNKQRYDKAPVTLLDIQAISGAPEGQIYLTGTLRQNQTRILDESGAVTRTDPEKTLPRNIGLKWQEGVWLMFAVERTS